MVDIKKGAKDIGHKAAEAGEKAKDKAKEMMPGSKGRKTKKK